MGRVVSSGGGHSSLGYLFGSGEVPKPSPDEPKTLQLKFGLHIKNLHQSLMPLLSLWMLLVKQIPAGIQSSTMNNHSRSGGDNICNFITDWPSTKVQAAPGGGSSLGYLFGGGSK